MTRVGLLIVMCFIGLSSFSQYDGQGGGEVSRFRPGTMWFFTGLRPAKQEKQSKYDRLIFDVTYNDWIGDEDLFQNSWASIGLNTNLMFDIPLTKGSTVAFGAGIAHQYTNIRHDNRFIINELTRSSVYEPKDSSDLFYKSIISGNSFSIPLELRFRKENWRHFKFHVGAKVGYQVNTLSKRVYKIDGQKEVYKRYGFPDENKWIYSAHVRLGIRNWALYASYNFNTLFSNSSSTKLNAVQMGLSVSLF
ncbi:MAG: hypothetical protein QNK85_03175 [Crocinitomicaceae bacterium]